MTPEPYEGKAAASKEDLGQRLFQMIAAYRISQMICVAVKLGIADLLKDGPRNADALAEATNAHAPSLYRLLRALSGQGIFAEDDEGRFALTPLANLLRSDVDGSLQPVARFFGKEAEWRAWGELLYSVTTGENAFHHLYGMNPWEHMALHPEQNADFDGFMAYVTTPQTAMVLATYDFSWAATVVDVGGGRGTLISAILRANPHLHGILCDAPQVVAGSTPLLQAQGVLDRCEITACDFFSSVPAGGDLYILKSVIHDWDDERAVAILKTCRKAVSQQGRLILVENVIPPGNDPHPGKITDIQMLVELGGQERNENEYSKLLAQAGFTLTRVLATGSPIGIVEAVPA